MTRIELSKTDHKALLALLDAYDAARLEHSNVVCEARVREEPILAELGRLKEQLNGATKLLVANYIPDSEGEWSLNLREGLFERKDE